MKELHLEVSKEAHALLTAKQPMRGTWPERRVAEITGIDNIDYCRSVLARMFDDQNGLGHLSKAEFDAAARIAAWSLFPTIMEANNARSF